MRSISDHITDLAQNSIRAGATLIEIIISENKKNDLYCVTIKDNGAGMEMEIVNKAADPFYTTRKSRKTGLGLALAKQAAEQTGGFFDLQSQPGRGTTLQFSFVSGHFDRPPLGDIAETLLLLAIGNKKIIFRYSHFTESGSFNLDTPDLENLLSGVPLSTPEIRTAVRELIDNNLKDIKASY